VIVESIHDIALTEWNALVGAAGLYSSHEWLSTVEAEAGGGCRYALVRHRGRLAAALPVYAAAGNTNVLYRPETHVDRPLVRHPGEQSCLLGGYRGYRNAVLVDPALDGTARAEVLPRLASAVDDALDDLCERHGYFLFLTAQAMVDVAELPGSTPAVPMRVAEARLHTVGNCFDDYLRSLSATRRKTTGKEIRRFAEAGLRVSVESPWQHRDLVIRLVGNLNHRHGRAFTADEHARALALQREHLGAHAVLFLCRVGTVPVGLTMGFVWSDWLYLWFAGFDYERRPGAYEYFNVAVYEPLRYCYEQGLVGVHLGVGTHDAKGRRGAVVAPLFAAAHAGHAVPGIASATHLDQIAEYWRSQMSTTPGAYSDAAWHAVVPRGEPEGERR
jgi:hypothetical protein